MSIEDQTTYTKEIGEYLMKDKMNRHTVILSSLIDGATIRIQIVVDTPMNAEQLKAYYECKSITISDVEVL
jgi:hypothetical protein